MAKRATKRKKNFLGLGKRETYHAHIVRTGSLPSAPKRKSVRYLGTRIIPLKSGRWTVSFDRDSKFDDLDTAKAFVKSWKKNPAKFDRCVKKVTKSLKKRGKPGNAFAICKASGVKSNKASARARGKATKRNRKARKALTTKRHGNPATLLWNASQGPATADVYMMKMSGQNRFEIDVANDSKKHTYKASNFERARAIARQKLHEFSSNPSLVPGADYANTLGAAGKRLLKGVTGSAKKLVKHLGKRKNPVDVAVKRYEQFHGFPVNEVLEVQTKEHRHSVTYGIGQLIALEVIGADGKALSPLISPGFKYVGGANPYWDFSPKTPVENIVWLTAGEDNKQLLLDGGDQSLDLKALGFTDRDWHDHMFIGTIVRVWYRTKKKFEGDEEVDFFHDFGKEGSRGVLPLLNYKPKNPSLEITGGRYEIALPDKSIGNVSPGIVG